MILSLIFMTLLLLRYNRISLHQSSNFVQFPSNYLGSRTILLGIIACFFMFVIGAGTGAVNISISNCLYSSEASFMIYKDLSLSNNTSISFILLELILAPLYSLLYTCFVHCLVVTLPSFVCGIFHYTFLAR